MTATSEGCASSTAVRPIAPPYLFADLSKWQGELPDFDLVAKYCVGTILKATQSTTYAPAWFLNNWNRVKTPYRGAYHFLDCLGHGKDQAQRFLKHIARAGGWRPNDIRPIVDVERGGGNAGASKQQVIETCSEYAATILSETGRSPILYGRGAMRDLGITEKMGCEGQHNPSYTDFMATKGLVMKPVLWQYTDGSSGDNSIHGCPIRLPGWNGGLDLSVAIDGKNKVTEERLREMLL